MKAVLITRPVGQVEPLLTSLGQHRIPYYHIPAIEIHPRTLSQPQLDRMNVADILIFISYNAVMYAPLLMEVPCVLAVGESTQQALYDKGYEPVICPSNFSTEGLLALPVLQSVKNKRIAIIRGVGGREALQTVLEQRGALCESFSVYARVYPSQGQSALQDLLMAERIDCVVVTSGEILQNLVKMAGQYQDRLQCLPLIVISQRIARLARELGFCSVNVVGYENLVRELCQK